MIITILCVVLLIVGIAVYDIIKYEPHHCITDAKDLKRKTHLTRKDKAEAVLQLNYINNKIEEANLLNQHEIGINIEGRNVNDFVIELMRAILEKKHYTVEITDKSTSYYNTYNFKITWEENYL